MENITFDNPVLDVSGRLGSTGYIDYIRRDEFKDENDVTVMQGVDDFDRSFSLILIMPMMMTTRKTILHLC